MKNSIPVPLVREEIKNFQPYLPGKSIDEIKKKFKLKTVYKLASNENSLGSSKKIKNVPLKILKNIFRYPEGSSLILREKIAKKYKISPDEVIIGAGTDELIELVAKTYLSKEDNIIVSEHAFIRYKMAGELMGSEVISTPMKNFTHDLSSMVEKVNQKTKIVFIANPNNPTGTYNTHSEFKTFLTTLMEKKFYPIVVVDEAYYEYARVEKDYPDSLSLRNLYPNLLILRTFSKVYGLAGLRVGYGISRKEIISAMDRVRPPFNVSSIAQYIASFIFDDEKHITMSVHSVTKEKNFLYKELDNLGIPYIPSAGNFILIDVSPYTGQLVFNELLKLGVIVRAMDEYDFPHHIRVTVGVRKENIVFLSSLKKVLKLLSTGEKR